MRNARPFLLLTILLALFCATAQAAVRLPEIFSDHMVLQRDQPIAIWYQGESNHSEGMLYYEKMKALIAGWRELWHNPDLPFYYVQIAPFEYGTESTEILPVFWEAQAKALEIPGTGMAVIHDIGNVQDIHPRNKQEVGRRLALIALAKTYGKQDVVFSGPTFRSLQPNGDKLRVLVRTK